MATARLGLTGIGFDVGKAGPSNGLGVSGVAQIIPDQTNFTKGRFLAYAAPYSAYAGGVNASLVQGVDYWDNFKVRSTFPNNTDINWHWPTNPPSAGAVVGYIQLTYGNYDGGVPQVAVTPQRVADLKSFAETVYYDMSGDTANATILNEFYLTTQSGNLSTKTFEIAHVLHESVQAKAWFDTCTVIGTFVDPQGRSWDVRDCGNNPVGAKYVVFRSPTGAYVTGVIDKAAALKWLVNQGVITTNLWMNGTALGVEPHRGSGSLKVKVWRVDLNAAAATQTPALGVFANAAASVDVFADFMGLKPFMGEVHLGRTSLSDMSGSVTGIQKPGFAQMGAAVPLIPTGGTLEACAAGTYDATFTTIANYLATNRSAQSEIWIRLGWEFNHTFQEWSIYTSSRAETAAYTDAQLAAFYVTAFRRVTSIFRGISSKFKMVWCINNGVYDFAPAYPGDSYVDIIGDDFYYSEGEAGSSDPLTVWEFVRDRPYGLDDIADFAAAHGKPLIIPEWGVSKDYAGAYVTAAVEWAKARGVKLMAWWENNASYASLVSDGSLPHLGAALRNAFNPLIYPSASDVVLPTTVPVNLAVPTVSGTLQEGQTLIAKAGAFTKQPTSRVVRWLRNGTAIATGSSYMLTAADVGQSLRIGETASNAIGSSVEALSAIVGTIYAKVTNFPDITDYATNDFTYPSDLTNSAWNKNSSAMAVSSGVINLDGTYTAQSIVENATTTKQYSWYRTDVTKAAGTRYRKKLRIDAKYNGRQFLRIQIATSDYSSGINAFFDLVNGVAVYTPTANADSIAGYALNRATIAPLAFGWYKIEIDYYTDTATAGQVQQFISCLSTSDYSNHAGEVGKGYLVRIISQVDATATLATQTAVPANTSIPIVWVETTSSGAMLSVWPGVWTNQPTSYAFQWLDPAGATISGATSDHYLDTSGAGGIGFKCLVTPTNNFGTGAAASSDGSINDGVDHTQEWLTSHSFPTMAEPVDASATPAYGSLLSGATNVAAVDFRPSGNINTRALLDATMFYTTLNGVSETFYPATAVTGPIDDPTSGSSYARVRRYPAGHRYDLHTFGPNGLKLGVIGKNNGKTATAGNVYAGFIRPQFKLVPGTYFECVFKGALNPHSWMPIWFYGGTQVSPGLVAGSGGNPLYKPDGTHSLITRMRLLGSGRYHEFDALDAWKFTSTSIGKSIAAGNVQRMDHTSMMVDKGYQFYNAGDNGFAVSPDDKSKNILTTDAWNDGFHVLGFDWKVLDVTYPQTGVKRTVSQLTYIKDGKIFRQEYFESIVDIVIDPLTGLETDQPMHCLIGGQSHPTFVTGVASSDISDWDTYSLTIESYKVWKGNIDLSTLTKPTNTIPAFNDLRIGDGAVAVAGVPFVTYIGGKQPTTTDKYNTKVTATSDDGTVLTCSGSIISGTFATAGTKTITLTETPDTAVTGTNSSVGYGLPKTTVVTLVVYASASDAFVTGGATNLFSYSEQIDNAVWLKNEVTITANSDVGPDGVSTTADRMYATTVYQSHRISRDISVVAGQDYAFSVLVKKGTKKTVQIAGNSAAFGNAYVNFNLDSYGLPTIHAGSGTVVGVKVLGPYNGFWRIGVIFRAVGTTSAGGIMFGQYNSSDPSRIGYETQTTDDYTIFGGLQMEAASVIGNYTVRAA